MIIVVTDGEKDADDFANMWINLRIITCIQVKLLNQFNQTRTHHIEVMKAKHLGFKYAVVVDAIFQNGVNKTY